jgi:DNA-binding Lrp family transcriptional regulator
MFQSLDDTDIKITIELQKAPRIPIASLAKKLGTSRPTITKKLKRLIDEGFICFNVGLDASKINFKIALVGLEVKTDTKRNEVIYLFQKCPRILNVSRSTGKANILITVWGENERTLKSTVESFRDIENVDIVYSQYLGTPIEKVIIPIVSSAVDDPPCGSQCSKCYSYLNNWCGGCPSTSFHRYNSQPLPVRVGYKYT